MRVLGIAILGLWLLIVRDIWRDGKTTGALPIITGLAQLTLAVWAVIQ